MPVIVDTNCFANVFSRTSLKHSEFEPVLNWILQGKGQLVYGGSKYKLELAKAKKYLRLFNLLKETGKVFIGDDNRINAIQKEIESNNNSKKFNDAHLLAISIETKCRIICSEDSSSIRFVKNKKYFPKGFNKPVYYSSKQNVDLLCDEYVDDSLKPICKIKKSIAQKILNNLSSDNIN